MHLPTSLDQRVGPAGVGELLGGLPGGVVSLELLLLLVLGLLGLAVGAGHWRDFYLISGY